MKGKIVFMGTPDFAVKSLEAILESGYEVGAVVTVPDKPTGRGLKITQSAVKEYAQLKGLPVLQPEKLRDKIFIEELKTIDADIFVVVAFRMLPEIVWSMPRLGTFNLHASLLPQYRGAAPINHAIMNGETESGVTTFLLNEKIDEGEILLQEKTAITDSDNAGTLHDRLSEMGSRLVVETLDGLFTNTLSPRPQIQPSELKAAPKIYKENCKIDWTAAGRTIQNMIRGLSPYPGAYTLWRDEKGTEISMKIYESSYEASRESIPMAIKTDQKKELKIGLRDGFLEIKVLQISGKKKMRVEEFLRGHNVTNWKIEK